MIQKGFPRYQRGKPFQQAPRDRSLTLRKGRRIVEFQVLCGYQLSKQDDLAGVH